MSPSPPKTGRAPIRDARTLASRPELVFDAGSPQRRSWTRAAFVVQNVIGGVFAALFCGAAMLWQDLGGLGTVIWQAEDGILASGLLFFALVNGFTMLAIAIGTTFPVNGEEVD